MKSFREVSEAGLPVHVFPGDIKNFITGFASGSGSQPSFVAAGVLACSAGLIDSSSIEAKYGQIEFPNLYLAVVGNPGVSKTPPLKAALDPLLRVDKAKHERYMAKRKFWEEELKSMTTKEAVQARKNPPTREPSKLITDGTMEGLISHLSAYYEAGHKPHAVYMRDELKGHFGGMDKYHSGGGDDYETWLTLFSGGPVSRVLRSETIFIPDVRATVIGGIQPEVYHQHMQDKGDGMIDRFLVAYYDGPPEKTDINKFVKREVIKNYNDFMDEMGAMDPVEYSFMDGKHRKEIKASVQDLYEWCHKLGTEYECGAFKKWEQQFARLCIHLGMMHKRRETDLDIIEMAKELIGYFSTDWLKSRISGDDDEGAKVDGKVLALLHKYRGAGCKKKDIRQRIWAFRGKEKKKAFDDCMDRFRSKNLAFFHADGRLIHVDFVEAR